MNDFNDESLIKTVVSKCSVDLLIALMELKYNFEVCVLNLSIATFPAHLRSKYFTFTPQH